MKMKLTEQEVEQAHETVAEYDAKVQELYEQYSKRLKYITNGQWTLRVPEKFD